MKPKSLTGALIGAAVIFASTQTVLAAEKNDLGKREYNENCAVCHGANGKGDGPYVEFLKKAPTDLTKLAKNNKGVFPVARVYESIDGTKDIKAHGMRDMPIWGSEYRKQAAEYYGGLPYSPEAFTRARILALIEYIDTLQAK